MNLSFILTRRFSNHESRLLSRSHTFAIIVILDWKLHQSMWIQCPFFQKHEPKVIDHKMTFDPKSVEVTYVTLPKDHCVQVPQKYITVCGYSDPFFKNLNQRSLTPDDLWPQVCWGHMCDSIEYWSVMSSNFLFCISAFSWQYFNRTWWKTLPHQIWHELVHGGPRYGRMNT